MICIRIIPRSDGVPCCLGNRSKERIIASNSEHIDIIELMLDKKYDAASESMRLHLEKAKEASFAQFINSY